MVPGLDSGESDDSPAFGLVVRDTVDWLVPVAAAIARVLMPESDMSIIDLPLLVIRGEPGKVLAEFTSGYGRPVAVAESLPSPAPRTRPRCP